MTEKNDVKEGRGKETPVELSEKELSDIYCMIIDAYVREMIDAAKVLNVPTVVFRDAALRLAEMIKNHDEEAATEGGDGKHVTDYAQDRTTVAIQLMDHFLLKDYFHPSEGRAKNDEKKE